MSMSINPLSQLTVMIYEYLYHTGNTLENELYKRYNDYTKSMMSRRPMRYISDSELLNLIIAKARFEQYCEIQADLYKVLKIYGSVEHEKKED